VTCLLVLDLDGTIADTYEAHLESWLEAAKRVGIAVDRDRLMGLMGMRAAEIAKALAGEEWRRLLEAKVEAFMGRLSSVRLFPDAEEALRSDVPKALVTSSDARIANAVIDALGIRRFFKAVVTGSDVSRGKPDPEPLYAVSRATGYPTTRMVVVGDTEHDYEMGVRAGAAAYIIARGWTPDKPFVRSLTEAVELARKCATG